MAPDYSSYNMYNSYLGVGYNDTDRPYVFQGNHIIHQCYPGHYFNTSFTREDTLVFECDPSNHQYNLSVTIPTCVTEMPCPDPTDFGAPVQVNNTAPGTYVTNHTVMYSCVTAMYELFVNGVNHTDDVYYSTCDWGFWTLGSTTLTCPSKAINLTLFFIPSILY